MTHICIQQAHIVPLAARLAGLGWSGFAEPISLGGPIEYQYAADADGLIVEAESVPDAADTDGAWLAHVAFATPDIERITGFYGAITGTVPRASGWLSGNTRIDRLTNFSGVEVRGAWLPAGNIELEFWHYRVPALAPRAAPGGSGYRSVVFAVDNLSAEVARLNGAGIALRRDGERATGTDPDGNDFVFVVAPEQCGPMPPRPWLAAISASR